MTGCRFLKVIFSILLSHCFFTAAITGQSPVADNTPVAENQYKSRTTALLLSGIGSLGSIGLLAFSASERSVAGIIAGSTLSIFAPSFGHWYAHEYGKIFWRLGAIGGMVLGGGLALAGCSGHSSCSDGRTFGLGALIILVSAATYYWFWFYDLFTTNSSVDKYNDKVKEASRLKVGLQQKDRDILASLAFTVNF